MKWKTLFSILLILLVIYVDVWAFSLYALNVISCGEVCIPERPFAHPFLAKIYEITMIILIGPTFLVLNPILNLMDFGAVYQPWVTIIYFSTFFIWAFYLLILKLILDLIKNFKKKV